jgi:nucleoside-diphosphate-sugar epimerase
MHILITGATGFLGGAVVRSLLPNKQLNLLAAVRSIVDLPEGVDFSEVGEINQKTDWSELVKTPELIIHCAARVHVMNEKSTDPLQAFREVNVAGTLNFAKQAAAAGVKRFIFISSIKVNGEGTDINCKYIASDQAAPEDPYGISKYEAEQSLIELSQETDMELVIIRPTLVYGPGVKGNFLNLLKLCKSGLPLPFGAIHNARSMVYLENLVDLITTCIDHPNAAGQIFLASDGDDLSLTGLLDLIRKAMNKPALLISVPSFLFKLVGKLTGKAAIVDRLVGNLQVDSGNAKALLGWQPPYTVEQGIKATVDDFLKK